MILVIDLKSNDLEETSSELPFCQALQVFYGETIKALEEEAASWLYFIAQTFPIQLNLNKLSAELNAVTIMYTRYSNSSLLWRIERKLGFIRFILESQVEISVQ